MLSVTPAKGGASVEKSFAGQERQHLLTDLSCGSSFLMSIKAFNSIGFSDASSVLRAQTTGSGMFFSPSRVFSLSNDPLFSRMTRVRALCVVPVLLLVCCLVIVQSGSVFEQVCPDC